MNPEITEIIKELIDYKRDFRPKKHLIQADEAIEFTDLSNLIGWLLHWQKDIKNQRIDNEFFFNKHIQLDDVLKNRFKALFENCKALSRIFQLNDGKILYSPELSSKQKQEIQDFVDENHELRVVKIRRK